jgi:ABC-type antimicrobial peptide transport system permease subunit
VAERTGEIGIAPRGSIMRLILREAMLLVAAGLAIGIPLALLVARVSARRIGGLVVGATSTDPLTMATAATLVMIVALCAASLPAAARRASIL